MSKRKTILIVEDDKDLLELYDLVLSDKYTIVKTHDGIDSIELARSHKPDLIIMDIELFLLSGIKLIYVMKEDEKLNHIPIISITSLSLESVRDALIAANCDAYINKPIEMPTLLNIVGRVIGGERIPY